MALTQPAVTEGAYTETLLTLRQRVLRRLGFGAQVANPPPGMADLVNEFLSSAQTQLAQRFPELVTERYYQWTMVAGTRYYSTSADNEGATSPDFVLDPKKITWVGIEDTNGAFYPLIEGIDPVFYTTDDDQSRPTHYEIRQTIEVYPIPDAAYLLTVKGRPKNFAFASDSDVATVDPELIFLLALANAKAHYKQDDAQLYFTQVTSHLGQLVAGTHGTKRYVPKPGEETLAPMARPNATFLP
jgi:hypothetical protein